MYALSNHSVSLFNSPRSRTTPKTPAELRPQFIALCHAFSLDATSPTVLDDLRNPHKVSTSALTHAIETDALGIEYGTFRGAWEPSWLGSSDPMEWQRTGGLARGLLAHGVRSVVIGDLTEEWYLYSIANPIKTMADVQQNLLRYYREDVVTKMLIAFVGDGKAPTEMTQEELVRLFGEVSSVGQVHLPVRMFARDMIGAGFPVVRYEIRWTPEQVRPFGTLSFTASRCGCDRLTMTRICDARNRSSSMGVQAPYPSRQPA